MKNGLSLHVGKIDPVFRPTSGSIPKSDFPLNHTPSTQKISRQLVYNFLNNLVKRQTNRQTNQQKWKHYLLLWRRQNNLVTSLIAQQLCMYYVPITIHSTGLLSKRTLVNLLLKASNNYSFMFLSTVIPLSIKHLLLTQSAKLFTPSVTKYIHITSMYQNITEYTESAKI